MDDVRILQLAFRSICPSNSNAARLVYFQPGLAHRQGLGADSRGRVSISFTNDHVVFRAQCIHEYYLYRYCRLYLNEEGRDTGMNVILNDLKD